MSRSKCRQLGLMTMLAVWVLAELGLVSRAGAAPAAVLITKQGADYVIAAPAYTATVDGSSGMLGQMMVGKEVVVESGTIDLAQRKFTSVVVAQQSANVLSTTIAAQDGNAAPVDKALTITYEALPDRLIVHTYSTVGFVSGRGMRFELGHEVQMARSLEFKETVPMPAVDERSPWLKVKFYYASGATLGILNSGAGNPYNANENGNLHGYVYARSGYVANSEYLYTLIPAPGNGPTLGSPSMTVVEASTPAVYFQGQPIAATLRIAKADYTKLIGCKGLAIKYSVIDAFENVVARGSVPLDLSSGADPIEVKVPLHVTKLGWYRASFTVNDQAGGLLEADERLIFSVLKHLPNMGERFDNVIQTDYTIGLGLDRETIPDTNYDQLDQNIKQIEDWTKGTDVAVTWAISGSPVGPDPAKFGDYCKDLFTRFKGRINQVEIINEPNGNYTPKQYIDTFLRPAYTNIKAADPSVQVVGPVLCGISPDQRRYLHELYQLGLKNYTDKLSFHPYAGNFDDGDAISSMDGIAQEIADNGDSNKEVYFTESGYGHNGWNDLVRLRDVIKNLISQYVMQNAELGIDYRHNMYYFTDSMGYLDFWLRATQLTPAAVAMRQYASLTKDLSRPHALSFGSLTDVRAYDFPGPARQVLVLWTSSNNDDLTTTPVSFTTAAKNVELFDCFGNSLPLSRADGKINFDLGTYPTYLVLPAGESISPVIEDWGTNVALSSLGSIAEATSEGGANPAVAAIDGNTSSDAGWMSETANDLPQSLTVSLAGPTPIDRVGLWSYNARAYDIDVMGPDGKWRKVVTKRDQPYQRFRVESFPLVTTDQVRLTILDSYSPYADVAEMQVFSPSGGGRALTDVVNWALASNGATASASSELDKTTTVAQQDWGANKPTVTTYDLRASPAGAIDGKRIVDDWRDFFPTTWMAAPGQPLPQWLEVDFAGEKRISSIAVYTIAFQSWTPDKYGIRDWDVQVWSGDGWKTVDTVTGNTRVSHTTRLATPVSTSKIRILVKATNDPEGTVGIMEVQAFGPAK